MGLNFVNQLGSNIQRIGSSMSNLGGKLTKYVTLPLAGVATASFTLGKNFEKELSKVTGLVGVSKDQVDDWGGDILTLAPKLGKAPQELAEALFFVTSAGLRGAEAMDVLELSGKASAAGMGDTATIADLVTSAMNAYGSENLSASKATDILTAAVKEGKAEASELASSMGAVLPLASSMGVSFDQVAAAQAAMTRTGTDANEAATQLKGIMAGLLKPSKQAEDQLKAMGTSSADMRKKIKDEGLISALFDLKEMTNKYGEEAMARVFPNIRALMGTLDLMGESANDNAMIFDKVSNSTGSLDKAFKAASETVDFKWNAALAQVKVIAINFFNTIKSVLIPVLENLVNVMSWLTAKFQALAPGQQQMIILFGALAAAVGPVLLVLGTLIGIVGAAIGGLVTIITGLITVISTVGLPVLAVLAAAFAGLVIFITTIIATIGIWIAAFIKLFKTNEDFRAKVIQTWNTIKANAIIIFNEIKKTIQSVLKGIQAFWKAHGKTIMAFVKNVWNLIMEIIKAAMYIIKDVIKLICAVIRGDWKGAWNAVKTLTKNVAVAIKAIIKALWDVIKSAFKGGLAVLNSIVIAGLNRVISFFTSLNRAVINKVKNMISAVKTKFRQMATAAANLAQSLVTKVTQKISKLASKGREAGNKFIQALKNIDFVAVGAKIINGIIKGIKGKIGELGATANNIASTITNKLPFSPAKEGPLKNLDKVNFSDSILKSLRQAEMDINKSFLANLMLNGLNPQLNIESGSTKAGTTLNNPQFNFHGIQDVIGFMNEIQRTLRRYGGKF
jgi:TP901 family phage tail tape measure protein